MRFYPVAKPFINNDDRRAVLSVLNTSSLSLGPKCHEFEKKFAEKLGVKYACAVSSGTAGLHLAMLACGIGPGDEVITSTFSFVASANSILYVGAKPVFVDIDPVTYNIDPKKIEAKITEKTKAILVVHIFGQPCDMAPLMRLAKKYKLQVIEDACEALAATYRGRAVGTFGQAGIFAFYPNKQMTTGEGGMIITNSKKIYTLCDCLKNQGREKDDQWLDHKYLGYNYRLDEMSAALGISQLAKLDFLISKRRQIAAWYDKFLKPYADIIQAPFVAKDNTHTWFVYVIKIKDKKINRDQLIAKLEKTGITTRPYLPSIHLLGFYKKSFGYKKGDFPLAEDISSQSLALPIYIGLKEGDCRYIVNRLIKKMNKMSQQNAEDYIL